MQGPDKEVAHLKWLAALVPDGQRDLQLPQAFLSLAQLRAVAGALVQLCELRTLRSLPFAQRLHLAGCLAPLPHLLCTRDSFILSCFTMIGS